MMKPTEPEARGVGLDALVSLLLRRGYYPVSSVCAGEGAMLVNGQWHNPRWGCDTLQHVIEEHGDELANGGLTMDSTDSTYQLKRLVARLYEHADAHDGTLESDLREAASRLEQMALALRIVHTWASVPGALDPKHTAAMAANALRQC